MMDLVKFNFGGTDINSRLTYWNSYYKGLNSKPIPSQFAAFILNEFNQFSDFVDIGCGNGRDAFFFSKFGKRVLGLDGSEVIIQKNKRVAEESNLSASFKDFNLFDDDILSRLRSFIDETFSSPVFYSRFFLHVLDDKEIYEFFKFSPLFWIKIMPFV